MFLPRSVEIIHRLIFKCAQVHDLKELVLEKTNY